MSFTSNSITIKSMNILLQEMVKAKEHKVNKIIIPRYVVIVVRMDTLLMIVTKNVNILPYTNSIIIKKPQSNIRVKSYDHLNVSRVFDV